MEDRKAFDINDITNSEITKFSEYVVLVVRLVNEPLPFPLPHSQPYTPSCNVETKEKFASEML